MAARHSLLIVDPDALSLRVLEVSLRKAGFEVRTATTAESGWREALEQSPELVLTDTHLPDDSGFDLARRLRDHEATAETGIIFLSSESSPDAKMRAIEAGADEFLAKPVLVKEIVHRAKSLLERAESESLAGHGPDGHLRGTLSNMGVVDILQVMEAGAKSGVVHLVSDREQSGGYVARGEARAALYFRDGQLVDGQLGALAGADALYRVLLWEDGQFEIEFVPINRPNLVDTSIQMVLLEGMRRVDEWSRFVGRLPSPTCKLTVDYGELGRRFGELPSEVRSVVHLIDGERSAFEVVDAAPVDDDTAVSILSRLLDARVIDVPVVGDDESESGSSIEKWLSGDIPEPTDLPSALGQAVIPSPHSPSEILAAAELPAPEPEPLPEPEPEPEPEPAPRTRSSSIVLSRRTVPANPSSTSHGTTPA
ncbi:MAG: response regulator, partial [Myxococcota bacterium]